MISEIKRIGWGGILAVTLIAGSHGVLANQTLIFIRHGEKPVNDSGQLTCKGLNRALALPGVLIGRYGKPDAIFAAGPKENKPGSSLRPLTTITPTAIRLSLPIVIQYHADDIKGLEKTLLSDRYQDSVVYVSWEHKYLDEVVKHIVKAEGGNPDAVPAWPGDDFDSVFVLKINQRAPMDKVAFTHESENLNGVADECKP